MRKIIFFIAISIFLIPFSKLVPQGEWEKTDSPTSLDIWKISCVDTLNCWAAGDFGLIINTTNGGVNWKVQDSGVSELIQDIFFLNREMGWAVTTRFDSIFGSYILKTTNSGEIWEKEFFSIENKFFHTIYFLDSLNGWVAGGPSDAFYRTTDGGVSWKTPQFDSTLFSGLPVQNITFFSEQYGFACGGLHDLVGIIWKTTNSGLSWSSQLLGPEPLRKIKFIDSLNIIGVGGDFEYGTGVARSTDGGENWIYEEPGFFGVATGLSFRKIDEAWGCLSSEAKFILSHDSGKTWIISDTPFGSQIYDIVFIDSLHGFAVGDGGVILKYKPTITSAIESEIVIPTTTFLFQNYPNPFNPSTKISWQSAIGGWQSLKIYDVVGNEVAALVNEYRPAGNYEIDINLVSSMKNPASGVYFYRLQVGDPSTSSGQSFTQTKKMLLLR